MKSNKIIRVEQLDNDLVHLTWVINNICPNSCSYCPTGLHNGKNHHYDWDQARKFFVYLFEKYSKLHCSVSGGEPSVSPFFKEIVQIFYENNRSIGVTSNASKSLEFWIEVSQYLNYICFSYHPEFPTEKFIEKVTEAGNRTFVTVRIMMHPKFWDHCVDVYNSLRQYTQIFVEPVRIFNWHGGSDPTASQYTEDQLDWFLNYERDDNYDSTHLIQTVPALTSVFHLNDGSKLESPNTVELINSGLTNFYGYTCEVGLKELFIDAKGDVYLGNCMINGPIGNIGRPDDIQWPSQAIVCNKTLCHCTTSVNINKWISEN